MAVPTSIQTLLSGNVVEWARIEFKETSDGRDRVNPNAELADLNPALIQNYLREVNSSLYEQSANMEFEELCRIIKYPDRAEVDSIYNYHFAVLEEALSNAVYHRGYDEMVNG